MKKSDMLKFMNVWPPYLGAGIKVKKLSPDLRSVVVELKTHFWNNNYLGTHFGGSLYSMVDPFLMLMLIENLGPNYSVWDKAATIKFKKAAKGTVHAKFELDQEEIDSIRAKTDAEKKVVVKFDVLILNESDEVVAEVEKVLSIKLKEKKPETT